MDREPAPGEIDVWHAARVLFNQYGNDARFIASRRADALLEHGDLDGSAVWRQIGVRLRFWIGAGPLDGARVQ